MAIEAALFDVAGVLLMPDPDVVGARLSDLGIEVGDADFEEAHYAGVFLVDGLEEVDRPRPPYLTEYVSRLGVFPDAREAAASALLDLWSEDPIEVFSRPCRGVPEGLRTLADGGVGCAVVSNSDGTVAEQLRTHRICQVGPGPGVPVRAIIDSAVVGVVKPDPAIFRLGLEAVGAEADRAVYVGDSVRYDITGALSAGMHALHFDPYRMCTGEEHEHVVSLVEAADWVLAQQN